MLGPKEKVMKAEPGQWLWGERGDESLEKLLGNKAGDTSLPFELREVPLPFWATISSAIN